MDDEPPDFTHFMLDFNFQKKEIGGSLVYRLYVLL